MALVNECITGFYQCYFLLSAEMYCMYHTPGRSMAVYLYYITLFSVTGRSSYHDGQEEIKYSGRKFLLQTEQRTFWGARRI